MKDIAIIKTFAGTIPDLHLSTFQVIYVNNFAKTNSIIDVWLGSKSPSEKP